MSTTEEPTPAPEEEPTEDAPGPIGDEQPMDGDDVRGPEGEELQWPEPGPDPEGGEAAESLANDETPGAAPAPEEE